MKNIARECIKQGRKLFILHSNLENPSNSWINEYLEKGVIIVRKIDDIINNI